MTADLAHRDGGSNRGPRLPGRHRPGDDQPTNGRRLIAEERRKPAGWMPPAFAPAVRQVLAPTFYADRALHADATERTGVLIRPEVR